MIKVKSNNIDSVGFFENQGLGIAEENEDTRNVLQINFKNGGMYEYYDVTYTVFKDFLEAESKGKFFHKFISKCYEYKRI